MAEGGEFKKVAIPTTEVNDGTVFYHVNVEADGGSWSVLKRYSQFEEFHAAMQQVMGFPPTAELPGKRFKLFTSHVDPEFVEERRCILEAYLKRLVESKGLGDDKTLRNFLNSDKQAPKVAPASEPVLEDVEVTGISAPSTRIMTDHVLYQIDVVNEHKRKTFSKWTVLKRFGQIFDMDAALRESLAGDLDVLALMPPPPQRHAKIIFDHMDEAFIEQRRVLLENYLSRLIKIPGCVRSPVLLGFLGVE